MKKTITYKVYISGFTLLELMISLSVGLALLTGVVSIFVGMKTTTVETSAYGELQENGRFAISVLSDDLLKQNFWGDYSGTFGGVAIGPVPAAPPNECNGEGLNNGTFPNGVGPFRTLWGQTLTVANPMGCFTDGRIGTDVIQLKRVIGVPLQNPAIPPAPPTPVATTTTNNFFLVSNMTSGAIFPQGAVPTTIDNPQVWQYQHHVYYIRDEVQGTNTVPVLMQGQLTNQMAFSPIIDGIEQIRFMYGVDTETDSTLPGYGIVNAFISADNMTDALWNNEGGTRIIAIKIYVLARSIRPDNDYINTSTYQLGDLPFVVNDNFRRLLFTSTVTLYNAGVDSWVN
jgi:type IV pilus assembly protein PilW